MNKARRCANTLFNVAAVVASTGALAQIGGPSVQGGGVPGLTDSGPQPVLVSPANGAQIQTRATQSTSAQFSWRAPNGPAVQRYLLCVAPAGASCTGSDAVLVNVGNVLAYQAIIPPRFHDKQLQWTVAACGPGYGGGLAVQGSTAPTDCSWARSRTLNAAYQAPVLNLLSPLPQARAATPSQRFTWSGPAPGAGGVDGYRFCLAPSEAACQQASLPPGQGIILALSPEKTFADVNVQALRQSSERTLKWTVLSCKAGTCRLAAGQPIREFIIGAPPAAPTLTAPAAGSAQPVTGDVRTHGYVRQEDGREVRSRTFPASVDFKWTTVAGATTYKFCLSPQSVACGNPGSQVVNARFQGSESLEWQNLTQFHGQNINWTVAACDALGCGPWAAPWPVTIKGTPAAVTLLSPADGATLPPGVSSASLSWSAVPFAELYQIYIGNSARPITSNTTTCSLPRVSLPAGQVIWTVQACNVVACGPAAQPRSFTANSASSGTRSSGSSSGGVSGGSVGARAYVATQCN